jgi:RNA polymerase sigma-70 factor (ECF subfamily)
MDEKSTPQNSVSENIINDARKGDAKAFQALLARYQKSVYYLILKMVHSPDDAEDLTQEAFIKAFSSIHKFDNKYAFSTWLFRIATNTTIDFLRKQKVKIYSIDTSFNAEDGSFPAFHIEDTGISPQEQVFKKERSEILNQVILQLPPKYQTLVELRYFQELSYEEIAKKLDIPLGTVKAQLFRARELLNAALAKIQSNI